MNDWMKQRDLLIEEALSFAQAVAARAPKTASTPIHQPDAAQVVASLVQRPVAALDSTLRDTSNLERTAILRQVADFKAHQQRFEQEREDYFQKTMAMARANEWAPQSRDKR